jgi:putative ABC transport system permease protein
VVRDVSTNPLTASYPGNLYVPSQRGGWESNLFIRASNDPNVLAGILSRELQSIDNDPSITVRTINSVMMDDNPAFLVIRTIGTIFSLLGLLGLVLASVGIYSMVGYAVSQQTREIGIRMALGAKRTEVRRMILVRSMRPIAEGIAAGLVLGVIVSLLMSRAFAPLKFLDARAMAAISVLVVVIGLVAAYIPARRAMNLDPSAALRKQ